MRTDFARLALIVFLSALAAGCQSNWDWWRSSRRSTPGGSTMAGAPAYQPTLPSAAPQPGMPGAAPAGVAAYPNTGYPAGPGAAGTTLTTTAPAGGYPVAGASATTPAWPTSNAAPGGTSVSSPYPNPGAASYAQTAPPIGAQPGTIYPTTSTPGGTMAPQAGPYNGAYSGSSDALAKAPAAGAAMGDNRYAGDSSTGDRYAAIPNTGSRYDVTAASAPPTSVSAPPTTASVAPPVTDRYGAPVANKDAYNPRASYVASNPPPMEGTPQTQAAADRYAQGGYGLPPAGGTGAMAAAPGPAVPPIAKPTAERYGSGVGAEADPGVNRYQSAGSELYPPAGTAQPADGSQPGAAPTDEYQPGSIKRYVPPGGTTTTDTASGSNVYNFMNAPKR